MQEKNIWNSCSTFCNSISGRMVKASWFLVSRNGTGLGSRRQCYITANWNSFTGAFPCHYSRKDMNLPNFLSSAYAQARQSTVCNSNMNADVTQGWGSLLLRLFWIQFWILKELDWQKPEHCHQSVTKMTCQGSKIWTWCLTCSSLRTQAVCS